MDKECHLHATHVRQDASSESQSLHWNSILAGVPELSSLSPDYPRPAVLGDAEGQVVFALNKCLMEGVERLGRKHGLPRQLVLMAGWSALLARFSGQHDIVVGVRAAVIGQFGEASAKPSRDQMIPIRLDLGGQPSTAELVDQAKAYVLGVGAAGPASFTQLLDACGLLRHPSHHPLFQTAFVWEPSGGGGTGLGRSVYIDGCEPGALCDLVLSIYESGGEIACRLAYATELFRHDTAERVVAGYQLLLKGMLADESAIIGHLPILSEDDRRLVVEIWNATDAADSSGQRTIHGLFEEQAAKNPDAGAVAFGDERLSYGELNARANRLAHELRRLGVATERRVAICAERGPGMIVGMLAVLKAGGCYVPLDPAYPDDRLRFMLEDSGAQVLLKHAAGPCDWARDVTHVVLDGDFAEHPDTLPDAGAANADTLAYVIYTSGSTGTPKAVMVEHRNVLNLLFDWTSRFEDFRDGGPFQGSMWTGFSFDVSVFEIFATLSAGGTVNIVPDAVRSDPRALLDWFVERNIRFGYLPPFFVRNLRGLLEGTNLTLPFRRVLVGVEPLPEADLHWLQEATPGLTIVNGYGPTEATVFCTAYQEVADQRRNAPIGRPVANTRIYILDGNRQPVPPGVPGEIHVGGAGVARGYLNRQALTEERFVADPFSARAGARMYRTGDLARWLPDGHVEFLGRDDFQVKISGFRIELGEIEAALAEHPAVTEAAVLAREDAPGLKRLVAYCAMPGRLDAGALRRHLADRVPEHMVPVAFVCLERLPLTPNGKLDRQRLPVPRHEDFVSREYVAPQGRWETATAAVWAELLRVDRVGRHDRFLELGGNSLLTIQVVSRLRTVLGVDVPLRALFVGSTLAEFSEVVAAARPSPRSAVARAPQAAREVPSFAQQRLWFLAQVKGAGEAYHLPFGWRVRGPLDAAALRRALDCIVARHESLRTTFAEVDGKLVQRVADPAPSMHLLEQVAASVEETAQLVEEEASLPFDLARGPLVRGRLIREAEHHHTLLVTMHHIVSDGWSMRVFMHELNALYAAFLDGEGDPLPALAIQYPDYAAWQRAWLAGDRLQEEGDYWQRVLSGAPARLTLPLDRTRPAEQSFAGGRVTFALDAGQARALGALSLRRGTTRFVTFLAGWAALLGRLCGQHDLVIGTPAANRGRAEIEALIGFFVNTLALRLDVSGDPTVAELLERVRERALEAQEHQDIPFEHVVERVNPERSRAYSPLFQVMFAWEDDDGVRLELPGATAVTPVKAAQRTAQFDLILTMRQTAAGIEGELEYATALFEPATVERMVGYYQALLAGMVSDPERRIADIPLLADAERKRLLQDFGATAPAPADDRCIHQLFEQQAERTPDAAAAVYRDRTLTYAQLNARANRLAHRLRALGVGPERTVAICAERSLEMLVAPLAVLKAGGAYVPMDPAAPAERLRLVLDDCAPVALLTQGHLLDGPLAAAAGGLPVLDLAQDDASWPDTDPDPADVGLAAGHLAYVIYTSGSTGTPKGVAVEHRNLVASTRARHAVYGEVGRFLLLSPIYFDSSVAGLFGTLTHAGTLVVAEQAALLDPSVLDEVIDRQRIDTLLCVPSLYANYLEFSRAAGGSGRLGKVIVAGEACPAGLPARSARQQPQAALFNEYGPTEGTVWATVHRCAGDAAAPSVPIGRPVPGARIYILDDRRQPVPAGVAGHLYIGGAGVARGYLNRPDLTAEKFVADPFGTAPGARMYRTGDLGRWLPDGTIEFLGRDDFQVKIRGFRIELGEIEAGLLEHPQVREAAVVARDGATGEPQLVAYLVGGRECRAEALRDHLASRLPEYMLPRAYVSMQALPRTPNGKLDTRALPAPGADAFAARAYEAPRGEIEIAVAAVWAALLKTGRVGRGDSFFALGGHSLLVVQVVSRLRAALQVDVPLNALFAAPVLADFSRMVADAAPARLPAVEKLPRPERLPLSLAQRGLWFIAQVEGANAAYNIPCELRLRGPLDKQALRRALDGIVARHEALRTAFPLLDGEPVQHVEPAARFPLDEATADAAQDVARLAQREEAAPFDLERGPLIRALLVREADDLHTLLVTMPHIVADGWSMDVFVRELGALYSAFANGQADPLPPLAVQYADYVLWQQTHVRGELLEAKSAYWKRSLAGAPDLLPLPTDRTRPSRQDYAGATATFQLDGDLTQALRDLGRRHGATMFMTLLAAWSVLLSRFSGQDDIVVGTPSANRGREEVEGLIGLFVNTLALRLDLSGGPTVAELLGQVKRRTLEAQEHQDIPFEQVVELVNPARSLAYNPLFQVMFAWEHGDREAPGFSGLQAELRRQADYRVSKFDLTLTVKESASGIEAGFEYATALFDLATIERLADGYRMLLKGMVADDAAGVARLPILSDVGCRQVVASLNATDAPFPRERCIHEWFEAHVARAPAAVAVACGAASMSYDALNRAANRLAHRLRAAGVKPDDRVAICLGRSLEMAVCVLSVLKAGAAYVPLDPAYPEERLRYIVQDCAPALLLTHGACPDVAGDVPVVELDSARGYPESDPSPAEIGLTSANLAYVIYTSGSTGLPKGAMVEHRNASNLAAAQLAYFEPGPGSKVLQFASFSFDACVFEMLLAFCHGGTLVVPASGSLLAGETLVDVVEAAGITHTLLPPAVLAALPARASLDTVRVLVSGGDVVTQDVVRRWAPGRRLFNAYGPTEITVAASLHECAADAPGAPPIGRPLPNTRIYVLDAHREPVPVGVVGELYIGGAGVARGYLDRPELTAERFVADPFGTDPDARMYKTGDLGRWRPDGTIDFLGRNDFQVKIRGFRIELGEIEARLRECAGVREAAVVAREDTPGDKRLVAYYAGAAESTVEALRSYLADRLPGYMVPAAFVRMDALPLSPNGKLDRKALPAPSGSACAAQEYEAPRGDIEVALADIWAQLLKVGRIGRRDHFFQLGGHSLLTVRVISRLRDRLGVEVPVSAMFTRPTLAEFAEVVAAASPVQLPAVTRSERGELPVASFAQRRQWFLAQMDGAATAYHIPYGLKLRGPLDVPALRRALDRIVARHESLRTRFVVVDGEPRQRIAAAGESRFALAEATAADAAEAERLGRDEAVARFDLEHGPLIRGLLVREAEDAHTLHVTMHHIVSDGWSMGVFVGELEALYGAYAEGRDDPLAPLELQYADYAVWQRRWISGELLARQKAFWKASLTGAPELLALPTDRPRPPEQDYAGDIVPLVVDEALTRSLKALGQRYGTTPYMTFLAGWVALLSRLSGQDDLVVGTPTANRGRGEIEGLIGFFVNTLALRVDASGEPTLAAFLERVKNCALDAQEHQDIPFEQVVELVNPTRSLAHGPLFHVVFSWEDGDLARPRLPRLDAEPLDGANYRVAKFDLTLSLRESGERVEGALEFATALFDRTTVERMAGYYRAMLEGMAADAERALGAIPILGDAERHLVTRTWNATEAAYPDDRGLHGLIEAQAARIPDAPAVAFDGATLTYAELNRRANRLAHHLRAMGVGPDDRVAICMDRGLEMLVGLIGILKAGGAYVAMDPTYPEERLRHILVDSAPLALLTLGAPPESVAEALDGSVPVMDLAQSFADQPDTDPEAGSAAGWADRLAYVIYTSGSTGTPKGVMVEHRSAVNMIAGWLRRFEDFGKGEAFNAALWTSFSFDVSVFELFTPLAVGATVHVVPDDIRGEPSRLFDWYVRQRIDSAYLPPFFVRQLDELMAGHDAELPFRYLLVGVEPLLESQLYRIQSSRPGPGIRIVNGYGPTETTVFSTAYQAMRDIHRNAPIGRPVDNTQTYILDAHLQPVPVGVAGELHIAGAGLARGYLNRPELTAERFVPDPFAGGPGARMYRTGDLVRWMPDGNIEFLGRNDHQVKLRGFRIELGEIETKLTEHPGIRETVVLARADDAGEKTLVAYCVGPQALAADVLRTHLASRLPKYMVPAAFVWLDALPLLPSGKLDQRALPAPDLSPQRSESAFVAPRNDAEARIAGIWAEVLGIPDIGIDDNFFDLGGESFKAFRVVGRVGGGIGVTELFKYPTVRQLAERVSGGRSTSDDLLHELSRPVPAAEKTFTLVCIPFPAGGPISYQALAKEMPRGCTVLGLEMPGHDFGRRDEQPLPIDELARRCAEEIQRKVTGPIAIYGHCAGGALTIALAAELEHRGIAITRLFIGGHFPTPHLPGKVFAFLRKVLPVHKWASQRSAYDILKSFGFFDEITDTAQRDFVMSNFVREHQEIEDFYTELYAAPYDKLKTPLTCVIGEMDRATELYQERHLEWAYFSQSIDVALISKAGHYFIKHQPEDLAKIIERGVTGAHDLHVDSPVKEQVVPVAPAAKAKPTRRSSLATFFTVAIGEIVSVIGSTLTSFALGVWVYQQTGLVSTYALMMVFIILPAIALSPVAGTLADRIDRKKIMVGSNCLAGFSTAAAAALIWTGTLHIWAVYVLAGLTAIANAFRLPAYTAMITQIVPKRYYGKANGFVQIGTGMGTFIGPALAGALIGLIGLKGIVITDFVSFLVAISTLLYARFPNTLFGRREEPFFKEMVSGWHYIIKRHSLIAMIVMVTIANYFVGLIESLITPLVLISGNPESLGVVMAANGAGILVGSALMSLWGGTERRINGILASTLLAGACIAIAGLSPIVTVQAAGMFGFGFSLALVNAHWMSTVQTKVGMELQGRVMATNFMLMEAMVPLGYLSAGPLADRVFEPLMAAKGICARIFGGIVGSGPGRGIGLILVLSGLFVALWAAAAYLYRPIRDLEDLLPDAKADEVIEADKDKLQEKADLALQSKGTLHRR
ncbi:MAG: amino acid adenylation domain-containing protein [Dyella sp.]|uniref:amino acid adenylation domain-containing protein n=1 Tax=Dyella sp. TaxID=1869338 RepID=UPI003F7EB280